jgi:hypothetical protein
MDGEKRTKTGRDGMMMEVVQMVTMTEWEKRMKGG